MKTSPNFTTVLIFSAIAFALAVTVAFLPSGGKRKDIRDLRIEYGIKTESPVYYRVEERNIFDFLRFRLNPIEVEPRREITRSKQPLNKKIAIIEQPESHSVRSPQEFVTIVEDNTAVILKKLISLVKQEREIRYEAIRTGNVENCNTIESTRTKADCREEIYFQKAVIENNSMLCGKIENEEVLFRCQNYFQ